MINERILQVLRAPHISEKAARLQEINQYVFEISPDATKADVKAAVESLFEVKVEKVNVVHIAGKAKKFRQRAGARSGIRKAYVRIADGQTIELGIGG